MGFLSKLTSFSDEEFSYLYRLENIRFKREQAERKFLKEMETEWKKIGGEALKEFKNEFSDEFKKNCRMQFLKQQIRALNEDIGLIYKRCELSLERNESYIVRVIICNINNLEEKEKRVKRFGTELYLLENKQENMEISDADVVVAKSFPFEKLIEVNHGLFALCPFHADVKPSLYVKNNFGYCFACGWKGDAIKFVMDKEHKNFVETVKFLNAGGD